MPSGSPRLGRQHRLAVDDQLCNKHVNMLNDGVIATLNEGTNVVVAHACGSRNRYQLFGLERSTLTGQMQARMHRSHVLMNVDGCAVVNGD